MDEPLQTRFVVVDVIDPTDHYWFVVLIMLWILGSFAIGLARPGREAAAAVPDELPQQRVVGIPVLPGQTPPPGFVVIGAMAWSALPASDTGPAPAHERPTVPGGVR